MSAGVIPPNTVTCVHVKRATGETCSMTVGLLPGPDGPLCAWHDPLRAAGRRAKAGGAAEPEAPSGPPPLTADDLPVKVVDSLDDAEKVARWSILAVALGRLGPRQAQAIVAMVREYRMVQSDAGVLKRAAELVEKAEKDAREFADLRRRVAIAKEKGLDV